MRTSLLRLAQNVSATPIPQMKAAVQSLLPPKVLYRRLLRAHQRHLPIEMRILGDDYVKAEFRRTRSTDNPLHIMGFLSEWKKYLDLVEAGEGVKGKQLDVDFLEKMSPEQVGQLYELMLAARGGEMTEQERESQIESTLQGMGVPTGPSKAQ